MRKKELKNKQIAYLLVFLQFLGLSLILITGPLMASGPVLFSIQMLAIVIGVWAVLVMRIGHFNILPIPQERAQLISKGPYSIIRHPMYTSILLFTLIHLINDYSLFRFFIFIGLCIALIWKLNFEEKQLLLKFEDYSEYRNKTFRILPYLY